LTNGPGSDRTKITIAYLPEEKEGAAAVLAAFLRIYPGAKVRKSDLHPPFLHTYLTTKKGLKALSLGEKRLTDTPQDDTIVREKGMSTAREG